MRVPFAFAFALAALTALPVDLDARCGTMRAFEPGSAAGTEGVAARTARAARNPIKLSGRVLVTPHFALHYSLARDVHQPAWKTGDATDAALRAQRDTLLLVTYAAADPLMRDSLMHRHLDSAGAPHPAYVRRAAEYFENAYAYFRDSLGMRVPDSNFSDYFRASVPGKFNVDIADLDTLEDYEETYGVTWPPAGGRSATLTIENDFLYKSRVNAQTGLPQGRAIVVRVNGTVLHDYSVEWDEGLAVTIAHELYHAVQFEYTHRFASSNFHSWYEIGAVAMEERLAPEVNDYLGYLPAVLGGTPVSLNTFGGTINYGNGIFHTFLGHRLGSAFDKNVWDRLAANSNNLSNALTTAFGSAERWDSLFTAYAASLAIAGLPEAQGSPLAFSPDMAIWPRPRFDSALAQPVSQATLQPLSYRLIRPTVSGLTWVSMPAMKGGWRLTREDAGFTTEFVADSLIPISGDHFAVTAANASPTTSRSLKLVRSVPGLAAAPNPATASTESVIFSTPSAGTTATLTVVSESGRRVAELAPNASGTAWTWNLRDPGGRRVPPGVYYFGIPGTAPQTLLHLP